MCDDKIDILQQYQSISNRLKKKRLLKKPNVTEAIQEFENLGKLCEREDLEQYAGLSYQAAAKCQNSLGNFLEEAFFLLKSSKHYLMQYLKELQNETIPSESYFHQSYTAYQHCLTRLQEDNNHSNLAKEMIAGSITLEMGQILKEKIGAAEKASLVFEKALKFFSNSPVEKIKCLENLIDCYVELGNYNESLKLIDKLTKEAALLPESGFKYDVLQNAEILKVFLLLILQPTPQQISEAAASALEKYAWVEASNTGEIKNLQTTLNHKGLSMLSENLFLALQSLVMACQYGDVEVLPSLEADLIPFLKTEHIALLKVLMDHYLT